MSTKTTNLGLDKPAMSDTPGVTIPQLANNFDVIDGQLAQRATDLQSREINVTLPFGTSLTPAKVDGSTDDTVALQAMLNAGYSLFIPAGTTKISTALKYKLDGQRIRGAGRQKTFVQTIGTIDGITNPEQHYFIGLEDLNVVGNGNTNGTGLNLGQSPQCSLKRVVSNNFKTGLLLYTWVSDIESIQCSNCVTGFQLIGGTSQTYKQCYASNCTNGYVVGDINNTYGLGVQVLTYSSFIDCAADNMSQYGYWCQGISSTEFINCGAEQVHSGMFYFGSENNSSGVPTKYNSATIRSPRALLNDGSFTTNCFIKNDGANTIDVFGIDNQTISGTYTKLIDSVGANNTNFVTIHNSDYYYPSQSTGDTFSFKKASQWGVNSIANQSIPFQSQTNSHMLISATQVKKTSGNTFDLRILIPNNGDMCFGHVDIFPLRWSSQAGAPPMGRIEFFAQNVGGTVNANTKDVNGQFLIDTAGYTANVAGNTALRLGVTMSTTADATDQFMVFCEAYTDQTAVDWQRIAWI